MDTLSPLLLCGHAILYRLNPVYTFPQGINSSFIPTMNTRWTRPQAQRSEKTRKEKPESLVHIWFGLTGISAILLLLLCCVFNTTRITDSLSCLSLPLLVHWPFLSLSLPMRITINITVKKPRLLLRIQLHVPFKHCSLKFQTQRRRRWTDMTLNGGR